MLNGYENLNIAIYLLIYGEFRKRLFSEKLLENENVRTIIHNTSLNIEMLIEEDMQ